MAEGERVTAGALGPIPEGRTPSPSLESVQSGPTDFCLLPNHKNVDHGQWRGPRTWHKIEGQGHADVAKSKMSISVYLLHLSWVLSSF